MSTVDLGFLVGNDLAFIWHRVCSDFRRQKCFLFFGLNLENQSIVQEGEGERESHLPKCCKAGMPPVLLRTYTYQHSASWGYKKA